MTSLSIKIRNATFSFFETVNGGMQLVCKICGLHTKPNRLRIVKKHLLKVHDINVSECMNVNGKLAIPPSAIAGAKLKASAAKVSAAAAKVSAAEKVIKKYKKASSFRIEMSRNQFLRSYVGLIMEDYMPLGLLNSTNMRNIIEPICTGLDLKYEKVLQLQPNNSNNVLNLIAEQVRGGIKNDLKHRLLSLMICRASIDNRNLYGIAAQFIKNSQIQTKVLGLVELQMEADISRSLATKILSTLNKYEISLGQIVSITTDNDKNTLMTSKILSDCTTFDQDFIAAGDTTNDTYMIDIDANEHDKEQQQLTGGIKICRCAAYMAQHCILNVERESDFKKYLLNCRNLTRFIRNPANGYPELFALAEQQLPRLDCVTRWGSTFNMLSDLQKGKCIMSIMGSMHNGSSDENFDLTDELWEFIDAYCCVFAPLQRALEKFLEPEQQLQLHYGNFYAQWLKCKLCTEKIIEKYSEPKCALIHRIGQCLLQSIECRTAQLLSNECLNACLFMDPRFSHTLSSAKKCIAIEYLKKLWRKVKALNMNSPASVPSGNTEFIDEDDQFLNDFLENVLGPSDEHIDVFTKIENMQIPFLRADTNVLNFWKEKEFSDPELYALSTICFAVPPSMVSMEHVFSPLTHILTDDNNIIKSDVLDNIFLVKLNLKLLDNVIETLSFESEEEESE